MQLGDRTRTGVLSAARNLRLPCAQEWRNHSHVLSHISRVLNNLIDATKHTPHLLHGKYFFKALSREKPPAKRRTDADFESFRSILGEGIPMMEIK